jgi:hypothetical protein
MTEDPRVEHARALFAAWSSGDLDAPARYLTDDAVLYDVIGGEYAGWPAIRAYFSRGLRKYPDLKLEPTGEFWSRPDGLALTWVMSATLTDDSIGPHAVGLVWRAEGMTYLVFRGHQLCRESHYHDGGSRRPTLGLPES